MNRATLRMVKNWNKKQLLSKKNVISVGVGKRQTGGEYTEELCIVVGVSKKVPVNKLWRRDLVPTWIDGCRTDVIELGDIRALARTDRVRPAPGGVSVGHEAITAGTLGCLVTRDDETFILSNNHVLANSNDAAIGDPILQPGPHDGGATEDEIGTLEDFITIGFGGGGGFLDFLKMIMCLLFGMFCEESKTNYVDAAIARPHHNSLVVPEIVDIGVPTGWAPVDVDERIKKSGRTTELTQGTVLQVDATVQVQYGAGQIATFEDQIIAGPMSAGGDSGSAVLNLDNKVVGLLFAGSDQTTILNPIERVMQELNITI
jgi:hypothetical protein